MSTLEDLLPEMAGVFAAQESALANCVTVLTTQLHNLARDTTRHMQRVASLETKQQQAQATISSLQQQNEQLVELQNTHSSALEMLQHHAEATNLDTFKATLASEMAAQAAAVVESVLATQLTAMESKMTVELNEKLVASSHRSFLLAQQSEDAMQARVEMLEKKFEYLSKIKMEIKDLSKRMDKQDQTLDDLQTGLALLAKSVGSDEINDEDDDHDEDHEKQEPPPPQQQQHTHRSMEMPPSMAAAAAVVFALQHEELAAAAVAAPSETIAPDELILVVATEAKEAAVVEPVEVVAQSGAAQPEDGERADQAEAAEPEAAANEPDQALVAPVDPPSSTTAEQQAPEETMMSPAAAIDPSEPSSPEVVLSSPLPLPSPAPVVATQPESETPPSAVVHTVVQPEDPVVESDSAPLHPVEQHPTTADSEPIDPPAAPLVSALAEDTDSEDDGNLVVTDAFDSAPLLDGGGMMAPPSTSGYHPPIHHMTTAPNLSTVAYIRSRRQERLARRGSRRGVTDTNASSTSGGGSSSQLTRIPLSKDEIKGMWSRIFSKIVQLRRLQAINGSSPERTLFRKQNISMGARVKRLEETSTDLEDTVEMLEASIQSNSQTLQNLHQNTLQTTSLLDKKTLKLDEIQKMHAQTLVGMDEKLDNMEAEIRRARNVARRESTQGAAATQAFTQIATQLQDVTAKLSSHSILVESHEKALHSLVKSELPLLTSQLQSVVTQLRAEVAFSTTEMGKEVSRVKETLTNQQLLGERKLVDKLDTCVDGLYRDLLVLTSAQLVGVELAAKQTKAAAASATATGTKAAATKGTTKSLVEVSASLLQSVASACDTQCRKTVAAAAAAATRAPGFGGMMEGEESSDDEALAVVAAVTDKLTHFRQEVAKLSDQAAKAASSTTTTQSSSSSSITSSGSTPFEDHLAVLCTTLLRFLEELLVSQGRQASTSSSSSSALTPVKDLVIQLRSVVFLLLLSSHLVSFPQQLSVLQQSHGLLSQTVDSHGLAMLQMDRVDAVVKSMATKLDGFVDLTLTFAKDDDLKKSMQELFATSDELKAQLLQQVDETHGDALKRNQLVEKELAQLAGRVTKKLDKDEMLWTQEVLERQLQGVAKSALGEDDLVEIQRALRNKMDKSQFQSLLQLQQNKLMEMGNGPGSGGSGGSANGQPLVAATKCLSCQGELPPTKPQLLAVVQEQVQQEVARAMALAGARHHVGGVKNDSSTTATVATFNVSGHRSMEKHKKELLLAAQQQQQQHRK